MPLLNQTGFPFGQSRPLGWVLLLAVVCWLPYFAPKVVPVHDSLYVTESFHCFYSAMSCDGELIRWFPYGNYGVPANFYQLALHPTHYVVGLAGLLLRIDDTLLLAKTAMLLNELVLALGLFLLSRELYSLSLTQFLVSIGGVLSVSWFQQAMFNLFFFYLVPLVMFFMLRFFKTSKPTYLFAAGTTEICSLLGNVTYAVPMHFWVLTLYAVVLACEYPQAIKALFSRRTLVNPGFWILLAVIGAIGSFMAGSIANLALFTPGRDPATGRATLDIFLDYGRPPMVSTLFGIITGSVLHSDNTYYIGILPLAMFAYALATESRMTFVGIALTALALIWLTIGGWFASWIFLLPGMSLYRHIALVYGLIGVLLLLGAGFGFECLALRLAGRETAKVAHPILRTVFLVVLAALMLADFWYRRYPKDSLLAAIAVIPGWQRAVWLRIAIYAVAVTLTIVLCRGRKGWSQKSPLLPAYILGLAFVLDIGSYRAKVLKAIPPIDQRYVDKSVFKAVQLPYRIARGELPLDERAQTSLECLTREVLPLYNGTSCIFSGFIGVDPCQPAFRTDTLSRGMAEMIRARGGKLEPWAGPEYLPPADAAFKRSLGCGVPKLRLSNRPHFARTDAEAAQIFAGLASPDIDVVLSPGGESDADEAAADQTDRREPHDLGAIQVQAFSWNRLRARVVVAGPQPVWLVYADAWNPGWQARIDGLAATVRRANLGLKAVRVESGAHDVEFYFFDGPRTFLAWGIALIGTVFGIALCAALVGSAAWPLVASWVVSWRFRSGESPARTTARTRAPAA